MAFIDILSPITKLIKEVGDVGDKLFTSDDERNRFFLEIKKIQDDVDKRYNELLSKQADISIANANNPNRSLLDKWRDACGWVCVCGLFWDSFSGTFYSFLNGIINIITNKPETFILPNFNTAQLIGVLTGMLGLGAYHTYERVNTHKFNVKEKKYMNLKNYK